MKRAWAVILTVATLAGCRTAQPTNPFLRTTVPPPATTPGVVVTPGTPYAQGISPPMVTTPAPAFTTPPPVTTQPVPVTPAPVAPVAPITAPPPVVPQGDRFNPPGGSYLYHQSSHESPAAKVKASATKLTRNIHSDRVVVQACYAPPVDRPNTEMSPDGFIENPYVVRPRKVQNPQAASEDGYIENPYVKQKSKLPSRPPVARRQSSVSKPPTSKVPSLVKSPRSAKPLPTSKAMPRVAGPPVAAPARPVATLSIGDAPDSNHSCLPR